MRRPFAPRAWNRGKIFFRLNAHEWTSLLTRLIQTLGRGANPGSRGPRGRRGGARTHLRRLGARQGPGWGPQVRSARLAIAQVWPPARSRRQSVSLRVSGRANLALPLAALAPARVASAFGPAPRAAGPMAPQRRAAPKAPEGSGAAERKSPSRYQEELETRAPRL